jgi:hypothetical protein
MTDDLRAIAEQLQREYGLQTTRLDTSIVAIERAMRLAIEESFIYFRGSGPTKAEVSILCDRLLKAEASK